MPLKIKCPSCHKVLAVKESMVGKRAACPACKYMLTIPAAPAKKPAAVQAAPAPPAPPPPKVETPAPAQPETTAEDAEALAAAMFSDEKKDGPTEAPKTIDLECPMCMEPIHMDISLAGKQAPCPECRRVIKVPLPAQPKKADWRAAQTRPTAARLDTEPAPEGAWGTTVNKGIVSKESLEEAGALPDRRQPLTVRQWIARGFVWAAAAVFLVGGTMFAISWFSSRKEAKLLASATESIKSKDEKGPLAGVFDIAEAQYQLNRNEKDSIDAKRGPQLLLQQARGKLSYTRGPESERDALLIELALLQLDMAGTGKAIEEKQRLEWKTTRDEILPTLKGMLPPGKGQPHARIEGVRQVTRKLLRLDQEKLAEDIAQRIGDAPVSPAVVGVEMLRAGNEETAKRLGELVLDRYKQVPPPKNIKPAPEKPPLPELTVDAVALAHALGQGKKLPDFADGEEQDQRNILDIGTAVSMALKGSASNAVQAARKLRTAAMKLEALVAIADLAKEEGDSRSAAEAALDVFTKESGNETVSPWVLARLVRVGLERDLGESAIEGVIARIGKDPLRGWCQLKLFRSKLRAVSEKAEESLAEAVDSQYLSSGLAWFELARHNRRKDSAALDAVEKWDDPKRGFGLLGVLTAMREKE
jgi:hypothetical protein